MERRGIAAARAFTPNTTGSLIAQRRVRRGEECAATGAVQRGVAAVLSRGVSEEVRMPWKATVAGIRLTPRTQTIPAARVLAGTGGIQGPSALYSSPISFACRHGAVTEQTGDG